MKHQPNCMQGRIQGGGVHPARAPPKIGKIMIFWRKIVIFHISHFDFALPCFVFSLLMCFIYRECMWSSGLGPWT